MNRLLVFVLSLTACASGSAVAVRTGLTVGCETMAACFDLRDRAAVRVVECEGDCTAEREDLRRARALYARFEPEPDPPMPDLDRRALRAWMHLEPTACSRRGDDTACAALAGFVRDYPGTAHWLEGAAALRAGRRLQRADGIPPLIAR